MTSSPAREESSCFWAVSSKLQECKWAFISSSNSKVKFTYRIQSILYLRVKLS